MDYEKRVSEFVLANPELKIAAAAVQAMKNADLNRFRACKVLALAAAD